MKYTGNELPQHYLLGRDILISKPIAGWNPPDTKELKVICELLQNISKRIWHLRIAALLNNHKENGKIRRIVASRKKAVKKAYQKGLQKKRRRK